MAETLPKGTSIAGAFTIQFLSDQTTFSQVYRAKDKDGKNIRLELVQLTKLPSSYFDVQGNLLQVSLQRHFLRPDLPKQINAERTVIENQPMYYIAYEQLSGETLQAKFTREGCLTTFAAVPLAIDLLHTLDYLHNLPEVIIHNNINTQSVYLDYSAAQEKLVLLNFGHARRISSQHRLAIPVKSWFNVAPEVLNGVFTPQSDLYAVGALLYQILTGLPPHYDEKVIELSENAARQRLEVLRERPLSFNNVNGILDDHLRNTITKALSTDVSRRFQTASDFIKALTREVITEKQERENQSAKATVRPDDRSGKGFDLIAGMASLKESLYNDVIRALQEKELYASYGVSIPNGMLLYGPPGCGKTFIAQQFAEEVGFNFKMLKPSDVQSKYINATQENIGRLFKEAEEQAPTILFFDELDALMPSREGELHHMHASAVNEFLAQMTNCGDRGIFIIGATNRPDKIDTAILRTGRLDKLIYLPPPDQEARKSMFEIYLRNRPLDLGLDYEALANLTANRVSSDIKFLIDEAARKALKSRSRISMNIFQEVLQDTKPSVSLAEIRKYELLKQKFEADGQI